MSDLRKRAKDLVDDLREKLNPQTPEESRVLGVEVAKACGRDRALLSAAIEYMQHRANESCGPSATHDCAWRGGRAERQ